MATAFLRKPHKTNRSFHSLRSLSRILQSIEMKISMTAHNARSHPAACKSTVHFTRPLPNMVQPILVEYRMYGCSLTQPSTRSPLTESRRKNSLYLDANCFSHLAVKLFQYCQNPNTQDRLLEF